MAGDQFDQRLHAALSPVFKPGFFTCNLEIFEPVDMMVCEDLQELFAHHCFVVCLIDMEGVESAALGGS